MNHDSIRKSTPAGPDPLAWITARLGSLCRWPTPVRLLVRSTTIRPTRLSAHLQADIGLRDIRPTRRELADADRKNNFFPGAEDFLCHRIWTDYTD